MTREFNEGGKFGNKNVAKDCVRRNRLSDADFQIR